MGEKIYWWEIVAIVDITVEILSNSDRFFFFYLLLLCFVPSMRTLPKSFKACNTIKRTKIIWRHTVLQQWKKINVPHSCLNLQLFQVIIIMKGYGMICVRLLFDAKQKVYSGIAEPSPRMWAGVSSSQQRQKAVVKSNRFLAAFSLHKKSQKHSYPFWFLLYLVMLTKSSNPHGFTRNQKYSCNIQTFYIITKWHVILLLSLIQNVPPSL